MTTPNPALWLSGGRPVYRYYLAWTISGDLALELPFAKVTWSRQIRRAGTFSGEIAFDNDERLNEAYSGTMPGKMSLYVVRAGRPVWGGIVTRRTYNSGARILSVEATGFESYLYRRFIWCDTVQASSNDQYQVVRNLIGLMQTDFSGVAVAADRATPHPDNGNIGLLVDSSNSGKHQDNQVWRGYELKSFGEALETFSDNLNGFEYNIEVDWNLNKDQFTKRLVFRDTPPSQLPAGVTYGGIRTGLDENFFEYPGNVITLGYEDSIDETGTRQWVLGAQPEPIGDIELPTRRAAWENEPYLSTQWPLLEVVESSEHNDVAVQSTLDAYARVYGLRSKPPAPQWTITVNGGMNPHVGSFNPGDWCRLVVTDPFLKQAITTGGEVAKVLTKRIAAFSVTVPDTEQIPETVDLTLVDEWDDDTT